MAVNPYFNNFAATNEQNLLAELIQESSRMYGYPFYYLPRTHDSLDPVLKTDDMRIYEQAIPIEMYIENVEAFEGQGDFLSRIGLEVRNRMTLTVSRKTFEELVQPQVPGIIRPREGDPIYGAMTKKLFEIMWVDNKADFYPLGSLPIYRMQVEVFEYSSERFNTGIPDIDAIEDRHSLDEVPHYVTDDQGDVIYDDQGRPEFEPDFDPNVVDPPQINQEVEDMVEQNFNNLVIRDPFKR